MSTPWEHNYLGPDGRWRPRWPTNYDAIEVEIIIKPLKTFERLGQKEWPEGRLTIQTQNKRTTMEALNRGIQMAISAILKSVRYAGRYDKESKE